MGRKLTPETKFFIKIMLIFSLVMTLLSNWVSGLLHPPQLLLLLDLFIKSFSIEDLFYTIQIIANRVLPFYILLLTSFSLISLILKIKWIDKRTRRARILSTVCMGISLLLLAIITLTSILDVQWLMKIPALLIFFIISTTLGYFSATKNLFEGIVLSKEKRHRFFLILLILVAAGFILRVINLGKLNLWVDEILTFQASQSVLEKMYPTTESGIFYPRATLFSYISALPIAILGFSEFALRIPSVIFGVLTIFVTYYLGKNIKNEIVGITSALFIALFYWQVEFSRYARMYQQFQFFFLLSFLLFFKAYLEKDNSNKWKFSWMLSYIGCIFSHQLSITLLPIFAFTLWKKRLEVFKNKVNYLISFIILASLILRFIIFDKILAADLLTNVGDQEIQLVSLSLNNSFLISYIRIYPVLSGFFIATILGLILNKKLTFKVFSTLALFIFCNLFVNVVETKGQPRYIFYIFPIFVILSLYSIDTFVIFLFNRLKLYKNVLIILLSNLILTSLIIFPMRQLFNPFTIIQREYNDDLSPYSFFLPSTAVVQYPNYKHYAEFVNENAKEKDLIIAANPIFLNIYLKEDDIEAKYWLRQVDLGHYSRFTDEGLVSLYDNTKFIDSMFELERLLLEKRDKDIWIVVDSTFHLNEPVEDYLKENQDKIVYQINEAPTGIYKLEARD